jgi:hypothetical protein
MENDMTIKEKMQADLDAAKAKVAELEAALANLPAEVENVAEQNDHAGNRDTDLGHLIERALVSSALARISEELPTEAKVQGQVRQHLPVVLKEEPPFALPESALAHRTRHSPYRRSRSVDRNVAPPDSTQSEIEEVRGRRESGPDDQSGRTGRRKARRYSWRH